MTLSYIFALGLIALAACSGFLATQWAANSAAMGEAARAKLAEQGVTTTQIIQHAEQYLQMLPDADKQRARQDLIDLTQQFSATHQAISHGRFGRHKIDIRTPQLYAAYFHDENGLLSIFALFQREIDTLLRLERTQDIDVYHPQAQRVLKELPRRILAQLNTVVRLHRDENEARLNQAVRYSGASTLGILIILVLEGLLIFRPMIALVAEKQRRLREANLRLEHIANADELTQVNNRNKVREIEQRERSRADRSKQALGCILLDIDHFKQVNDSFGHSAGDEVLQQVAQTLQAGTRAVDYVIRWGGEEFLVLLPGISEMDCQLAAEKLRKMIASSTPSNGIGVTVSIGVTVTYGSEELDSVVARADEALYSAKSSGRDRVCLASTQADSDREPVHENH